ncbi:MAG: hypothetical protein IJI05_06010 [Erysipelotrichaceae bacterium]|nr:hypothetical protein [Erysipelotrichaceae bacterium]
MNRERKKEILDHLKANNYIVHRVGSMFGVYMFDYRGSGKNVDISINKITNKATFYLNDQALFDVDLDILSEILELQKL